MTNPIPPAQLVTQSLARMAGQVPLPKAGLLSTSAFTPVRHACQLLVK